MGLVGTYRSAYTISGLSIACGLNIVQHLALVRNQAKVAMLAGQMTQAKLFSATMELMACNRAIRQDVMIPHFSFTNSSSVLLFVYAGCMCNDIQDYSTGITLALFGGVQKYSTDKNKVPVRGDIHIIVVGDPGLGKSQLLQAAAAISPRGIYVCGNATTNAGLTVAVVKDPMTSDYAFEAGTCFPPPPSLPPSLPLSLNYLILFLLSLKVPWSLLIVDYAVLMSFDKMSAEHQSLLEAMEQQCVSVAKAGLVASLSARTSVLAAANPVGVIINIAAHTVGGIDMNAKSGSLVSRLRLDPKKDMDFVPLPAPLLANILLMHELLMSKPAAEILQKFYLRLRDHSTSADGTPITARQLESLVRLAEARARLDLREEITAQDALFSSSIKIAALASEAGFISKGLQFTNLAGEQIQFNTKAPKGDFAKKLSYKHDHWHSPTPLKFTEPKLVRELSKLYIILQDVVEIMKESLYDKYVDEHGFVDFGRSGGMSQQKEAKRFLVPCINKQSCRKKIAFQFPYAATLSLILSHNVMPLNIRSLTFFILVFQEIYNLADRIGLRVPDIDTFVDNLNTVGYLLKKGPKTYQVL
ncbi:putative DNA helicase MCM8 [Vitis vinifera]|uniref:DNA helicase n=1 Tax=Vitis vinifera TaxID=29760 RepID=A0A438DW79_VITVI|nr:putative DNA helicase MCM8 [Vitis vinifera]